MAGNRNTTGYRHDLTSKEVWEVFDALPAELKAFVNSAPYAVSAVAMRDRLKENGGDVEATLQHFEQRIEELTPDLARKAYGKAHPQAADPNWQDW